MCCAHLPYASRLHTEHSHTVCGKPTADEASASPAMAGVNLWVNTDKSPTKTALSTVYLPYIYRENTVVAGVRAAGCLVLNKVDYFV